MNHSESITKIAPAVVAAQAELRAASKTSDNPYFSSKYADLAECMDTLREPLYKNGLAIVQFPAIAEDMVSVETVLLHNSGEWFSCVLSCRPKDFSPQAVGSSVTYLRRYGLALTGLASEEDDDGNAGTGKGRQNLSTKQKPAQSDSKAPRSPSNSGATTPASKATPPAGRTGKQKSGVPYTINEKEQEKRGCINTTLVAELRQACIDQQNAGKLDITSQFLPWLDGEYLDGLYQALQSTGAPYERKHKGTAQVLLDIPSSAYKEILDRVKNEPETCRPGYAEAAAQASEQSDDGVI